MAEEKVKENIEEQLDEENGEGGDDEEKKLFLNFHGRVLEHLGIQMYQSPVNSIAELIANCWDADAELVEIELPENLDDGAAVVIKDDGIGMSFQDCQDKYLAVGRNCRENEPDKETGKNRPILGRKGIGKFAGFGIAQIITVETISKETGEKTTFEMQLDELMEGKYVNQEDKEVELLDHQPPDEARKENHGTVVILSDLNVSSRPNPSRFAESMARRFLLHQEQDDFEVEINGNSLPRSFELADVQYSFPGEYSEPEKPDGLSEIDNEGWGTEILDNGKKIEWRFMFTQDTIDEEELTGITIFANNKMAQKPFLFQIAGGLSGQHGVSYLCGQVKADYLDKSDNDVIATERQRVNWNHPLAKPLLEWGQERVKETCRMWKERRASDRTREIENKLTEFSERLDKLPEHERKTVKSALKKLAGIETLSNTKFEELGKSILTSWEQGRIRELISSISEMEDYTEQELLNILIEANTLTSLNITESVITKLHAVSGLYEKIKSKDLENAVRDYIAKHPWLISPKWETFEKEKSVKNVVKNAQFDAGISDHSDWDQRVDLVLASGEHLLVLEFMRPGLKANWDHISRFRQYVRILRSKINSTSGKKFTSVTGFLIAENFEELPGFQEEIESMAKEGMFTNDWEGLLGSSIEQWEEFLEMLRDRAPDERIQTLIDEYFNE